MAKKAKRKLEEEEAASFEFPVFDDTAFVKKEFELAVGLTLASLLSIVVGFVGWGLNVVGVPWWGSFLIGILVVGLSPVIIARLHAGSAIYTRGDWAGLIFLVFFGFLAVWLLLANISSGAL